MSSYENTTQTIKEDGKEVTYAHEVTLVLSSIDDPPRKPTPQDPKGSVGSAQKVAEDNKDILSKFAFKNAGAADPMKVALDQIKPSTSMLAEAARQSPPTKKSTQVTQEAEPPRMAQESSQGLLLDRLKKAFNISASKMAVETAAAPPGVAKDVGVAQSPKVSRGLPQWASARPSHSNAAEPAKAANSAQGQSPVAPRAWAVNSAKSSSAPDIRSSKAEQPVVETSTPKLGK